ncbi:hypothetical protein [Clostridium peptidivorans]|uniref:hypothetical protein n=1 Tax=Clostridium peptidivorans TaxID=100174 RepID=UPI000BE25AE2|nr:hypothetical protein [Clostridium peptidivorans]
MQNTANSGLKKPEGTDVVNIDDLNYNADKIDLEIKSLKDNKVDKVTGKGLSTNDYTTTEKNKLAGIVAGANNYVHPSTHPATIIVQDASHRFVSDTDKAKLDGIATGANNYTHPNSGATAGEFRCVTVNAQGHVTAGTNPTTLGGYNITDGAPKASPIFTGTPKAPSGATDYTTARLRNIYFSTNIPTSMANGDICLTYE